MVESVALLNPILKEETVTQGVIAYSVLHLCQKKEDKILKKEKEPNKDFLTFRALDRSEK